MRSQLQQLWLVGILFLVSACTTTYVPRDSKEFPTDVASQIQLPETESWNLTNGIRVVLLRDSELPMVSAMLYTRGGSLWADPSLPGAAEMMGSELDHGGAGTYTADEFEKELERHAASISASLSAEYGKLALTSLSEDFPKMLGLLAQVAQSPRFEEKRLALTKQKSLEGIRRRKDDPNTIAQIAIGQSLFPKSPYGRVLTSAQVKRLDRRALLSEYRRFIRPEGAILAIYGDITREHAAELAEKYFGSWRVEGTPPNFSEPPAVDPEPQAALIFVEKPLKQATIFLGRQGVRRLSPEYPSIEVFNSVFGTSGFNSRLMREVRTRAGLAYTVYGAIAPGIVRGKHLIYAQTKENSAFEALQASLGVVRDLGEQGPSAEEMSATVSSIKNGFVFKFDDPVETLDRRIMLEILKYPKDYDQTFLDKISAVTPSDVMGIARKHWGLEHAVLVLIGSKRAFAAVEEGLRAHPDLFPSLRVYKASFDEKLNLQ